MGKRLGGIAAGKSLSFRKGVCKGKGYRFCERDWRATLAHPLSLAARALANSKVPRTLLEFFLSTQAT